MRIPPLNRILMTLVATAALYGCAQSEPINLFVLLPDGGGQSGGATGSGTGGDSSSSGGNQGSGLGRYRNHREWRLVGTGGSVPGAP